MKAPYAERLLRIWEGGRSADPFVRARVMLLGLDEEGLLSEPGLREMTLGERDRTLFEMRRRFFGDAIKGSAPCPFCGERLEIVFNGRDVLSDVDIERPLQMALQISEERAVVMRVPTMWDLEVAASAGDEQSVLSTILHRCVEGSEVLSDDVVEAVGEQVQRLDPDSQVMLAMLCPSCEKTVEHLFDIAGFLWEEIEGEALRILRDVHRLASGYGWRESDILALSSVRRRAYLEMLPA